MAQPTTRPPARYDFAMAYDAGHGCCVLFGGSTGNKGLNHTWICSPHDLIASSHVVSVASGGSVKLSIDAGNTHGQKNFWVLGCMDSGGPRGVPSLKLNLRLNPDPYFWFTMQIPNPLIANALGLLDTSGKATATIQVPPLPAALIGSRFYHAYVAFQSSIDYASTPVPLELVK